MDQHPDKPLTEVDATHLVPEYDEGALNRYLEQYDPVVYERYGQRIEHFESELKAEGLEDYHRVLIEGLIDRLKLKRELMKGGRPHVNVGTIGHIDHGKSVISQLMRIQATKEALNRYYTDPTAVKSPVLIVCDETLSNATETVTRLISQIEGQGHDVHVLTKGALDRIKGGIRRGEMDIVGSGVGVGRSMLNNLCEEMVERIAQEREPRKVLIVDDIPSNMFTYTRMHDAVPCEWAHGRHRIGKGERKANRRDRWKGPQGARRY